MNIANEILTRYADRLSTRRVICQAGLTPQMPALLGQFLPAGRWLLVADGNTWKAQGRSLADALTQAGVAFEATLLQPPAGRTELTCEAALVEQVSAAGFAAVVAIGSGTICDTAKLAAAALPCAAVATAPSMNGYPSVIAAVLRDGVKMTEPTRPPAVVLADLDVLAAAPQRMIAAGLADLLAKPVSTADWTLAHELLGDPISAEGLAVVEQSARLSDGIAAGLPLRNAVAVARLFEALFVSGLAMAVSGASSPASGGEHLISHYLDMTAGRSGGHDLHGLQVGVATLVTAEFYRRLLEWDAGSLDIDSRVRVPPPWSRIESQLREHFGPTLAPAVIPQARKLYAEGDELARRLTRFQRSFPRLTDRLRERLRGAERIEGELKTCAAATHFSEIGVGPARALDAVRFAHFVRSRYTILHLLADVGLLDAWAGEAAGKFV